MQCKGRRKDGEATHLILKCKRKGLRYRARCDLVDRPVHHGGDPGGVWIDVGGDADVPGEVPAVGAEVAGEVAQADVVLVGGVQPLDRPHPRVGVEVLQHVGLAAVHLGGAAATVAGLRLPHREREVAAVGR